MSRSGARSRESRAKNDRGRVRPCRLAAVSYGGEVILCAGADNRLTLLDAGGVKKAEAALPGVPTALALAALGERAVAACDRSVIGLDVGRLSHAGPAW